MGELKLTIAQFFRVNGSSTQVKGVTLDIGFSAIFYGVTLRVSDFDNELPWTQIKALYQAPNATLRSVLPALLAKHAPRTELDPVFKYLQEDLVTHQQHLAQNEISLNEAGRRQERAARQADTNRVGSSAAVDDGMLTGERSFRDELRIENSMKTVKDIVLIEAMRIMNDAIGLLQTGLTRSCFERSHYPPPLSSYADDRG